jgi:hypothetical protein
MAGRRVFLALCWPLHHCLSNLLAEFFPVAFIELSAFMVCTDATLWVLAGPSLILTVDPYIPRAKRPPSYLGPFLRWLNATIDETAGKLAPCVKLRRRPCYFSTARLTLDTGVKGRFNPFRTCDYVFWYLKYLVAKCNFSWWRFRRRAPHALQRTYWLCWHSQLVLRAPTRQLRSWKTGLVDLFSIQILSTF